MKEKLKDLLIKALKNIKYPSTLKGLTVLAGLVGVNLAPEQLEAIATATVAVVGLIDVFLSDSDVA